MKKEKITFYNMFWLFILASVFGWVIEGIWTLLKTGKLINHSAVVIGPFNMAYGICACLFTALLYNMKNKSFFKIFTTGFIWGSIIEYIMSLGMEIVLGFTAWDYSRYFLNINGRICLLYSIYWGFLSVIWIKLCFPFVIKIIKKFNSKHNKPIVICIIIFLIFDNLLTIAAVYRAKEAEKNIPPSNKLERVLDKTFNKKYLKNMYNNHWVD